MKRSIAVSALAVVAVAAGAYVFSRSGTEPQNGGLPFARAAAPKGMPALQFEDGTGRPHLLADFKGKVVLLSLWATWCAPCREELPALDRLQAAAGGPHFEVLALSVDQQGSEVARKFFADAGVKWLALYVDRSAQAAFKLGVPGLPATFLVDADGRELGRHLGPVKWDAPEIVEELRRRAEGKGG